MGCRLHSRGHHTCLSYKSPTATITDVRVVQWRVNNTYSDVDKVGPILTGIPANAGRHNGCRLLFDGGGLLYVATGDAAVGTYPQDRSSLAGKVLRITRDGQAAPGNPFITSPDPDTQKIFTLGHRNPQGLALQPGTGRVWSVEHGTGRDDEINLLVAGGNYGWNPVPGYDESTPMTNPNVPGTMPAKCSTGDPTLALSGATFVLLRRNAQRVRQIGLPRGSRCPRPVPRRWSPALTARPTTRWLTQARSSRSAGNSPRVRRQSWGGDRTDVFVVGGDRALYHKGGGPGGCWAGWEYLGGR